MTFLCLVLSCEPGARVSVQVERKDEGNHTHLRSMVTKPKPIRPPPPPGIFGLPGGGSRKSQELVLHKTRQKSGPAQEPAEKIVKDIRRMTRRKFSAEEKIRIVLEGLRGEESIAELCRREGIVQNLYYRWSKDFLEAGKKRLTGDTARAATSDEVKDLRREASALKEVVAELTLENRLLKKSVTGDGEEGE